MDSTNAYVLDEPPEVTDLRRRADELRSLTLSEARTHPGDDLEHLTGAGPLVARMRQLAPGVHSSIRVLQPHYFYDPDEPGVTMARSMRARGVETEVATLPSTPRTHPLLSSIFPATVLGPVFLRAMLVDEQHLIVEGPDTAAGERTSFWTRRELLVERAVELWARTVKLSTPLLAPGEKPPLSGRQLQVARLLAIGEKDQAIARLLDMSARTVERDVQRILRVLGASSRTEAVLLMRGRGVNSGGPRD